MAYAAYGLGIVCIKNGMAEAYGRLPDERTSMNTSAPESSAVARRVTRIEMIARLLLRYGLVVAIGWIGAMKATHYEAVGIQPLIAHSPLLSWGYRIWSVDRFTMIIGATEIVIVALLAVKPWFPRASAVGSLGAICMFLTTLSFIITTPGWEPSLGGFPALSGGVGEFLIKDFVLLGASFWTLADSLKAAYSPPVDT
jgi:reactive chlorine resistance protein C